MKSTIQRIDSGAGSQLALVEELNEGALDTSPARHAEMLQRVTDLFTFGSSKHTDDEIALFDDIFVRLATAIEASARAKLANSLAKLQHAPPIITRALAFDDTIEVAAPEPRNLRPTSCRSCTIKGGCGLRSLHRKSQRATTGLREGAIREKTSPIVWHV